MSDAEVTARAKKILAPYPRVVSKTDDVLVTESLPLRLPCSTAADCASNGVCTDGACVCDPPVSKKRISFCAIS
jgi:hypothetical protein